MAEEAFHEIQLNGKQLVFLFMAGTVVAVVIFLCGVMVGRGVRAQRGPELAALSSDATADPTASIPSVTRPPAAADVSLPSATEKLSYPERLASEDPPPETLKAAPDPPRAAPNVAPKRLAKAPPEPSGDGFSVQVTAVREREEANTIVKRLVSKGYPAYVTMPAVGAPAVYRVRVGKFGDRRAAEAVATRLEREEHFRPWITR
jgi:cell division septation protein DedD